MGALLFELGKFRVIKNPGFPSYIIEGESGKDALGVPRWETVKELGGLNSRGQRKEVEDHLLELMVVRIERLMRPDTNKKTPPYDEVQL